MPLRNVGDRPSVRFDDDEGADQEGYALAPGDDPEEGQPRVKKATGTDEFVGVNYDSTYDLEHEEVLLGELTGIHQDSVVNVLCSEGAEYNFGQSVYLTDTPGIAGDGPDTNTQIGTVAHTTDLTGADGPEWVPVSITGKVSDE